MAVAYIFSAQDRKGADIEELYDRKNPISKVETRNHTLVHRVTRGRSTLGGCLFLTAVHSELQLPGSDD